MLQMRCRRAAPQARRSQQEEARGTTPTWHAHMLLQVSHVCIFVTTDTLKHPPTLDQTLSRLSGCLLVLLSHWFGVEPITNDYKRPSGATL